MNILLLTLQKEYMALQVLDLISLQMHGSYDTVSKKLTNVGTPTLKQYVDENSGSGTSSNLTIDSDIDMNDIYLSYSQSSNTI